MENDQAEEKKTKTILYAGNIGKCQALHKIIPQTAKKLGDDYKFVVVGDGGIKKLLADEIEKENLSNVEIRLPVKRDELIRLYKESDYLFIHLEKHPAFERVIPSKVFELGATNKPVIAGVAGYPKNFISKYLTNTIMFDPCDYESLVQKLHNYTYKNEYRKDFIENFTRDNINREMAGSIIQIGNLKKDK